MNLGSYESCFSDSQQDTPDWQYGKHEYKNAHIMHVNHTDGTRDAHAMQEVLCLEKCWHGVRGRGGGRGKRG